MRHADTGDGGSGSQPVQPATLIVGRQKTQGHAQTETEHRGHDRQDVFFEDEDYQAYLDTLAEFKDDLGVRVYAYCLMTNHVHLVLRPGDDPSGLGKLMKRLAGRHTRRIQGEGPAVGTQRIDWDGRDGDGHPVAAGVYVYRLSAGAIRHQGKLVRLR